MTYTVEPCYGTDPVTGEDGYSGLWDVIGPRGIEDCLDTREEAQQVADRLNARK